MKVIIITAKIPTNNLCPVLDKISFGEVKPSGNTYGTREMSYIFTSAEVLEFVSELVSKNALGYLNTLSTVPLLYFIPEAPSEEIKKYIRQMVFLKFGLNF